MKKSKNKSGRVVYKRLLKYVTPYWRIFVLSLFGYLMYAATQPMLVMIIQHIIDTLNTEERKGIEYLPLLFIALFFVRGVGSFLGNYFLARISGNVIHNLRCELFNHYSNLSIGYFDENNSGYMISRITHNVGEVTRATTDAVRSFVREGLTAVGLLAFLIYTNWQLSLVFFAIAPVVIVMVSYVSKRLKRLSRNMQDTVGDLTHITSELVMGSRIVKSFGGQGYERERFSKVSLDNRRQYLKLIMTMSIHNPLMQFVVSLALAGLMYLALTLMKDTGAGEFVAYLTAAFFLPKPIRQLSDANSEIQRGIAAAESLFDVIDVPAEKDTGNYEAESCLGRVEFKNLTFSYDGAEEPALKNINLVIEPGQTVALVGGSGGGKSTLINLLPRFYDYKEGEVLLDGIDIKEYSLNALRKEIALVTQNVTLFNTSVAKNIAYGVEGEVNIELVEQAAKDAYAMEFIEMMPKRMDTDIGENGVKLSGGQRQRLALARALFKNSPVLVLDEATSALDTASERYIQKALKKIMENRTTIVVAHRLSTIETADVILVLEKGEIIERGKHEDLINKRGAYARLHGMQFQNDK